jgi:ribonuclease P/MRP protein subunit POP1
MVNSLNVAERNAKNKKSRRVRRRTGTLLAEYARRAQSHAWLETHIWHAKRMHMVSAHGYRCVIFFPRYFFIIINFF